MVKNGSKPKKIYSIEYTTYRNENPGTTERKFINAKKIYKYSIKNRDLIQRQSVWTIISVFAKVNFCIE